LDEGVIYITNRNLVPAIGKLIPDVSGIVRARAWLMGLASAGTARMEDKNTAHERGQWIFSVLQIIN
jgi:hypothetical protein